MTRRPSDTAPAPSALIMLSPPPGDTTTPAGSPSSAATGSSRAPMAWSGSTSSGSILDSEGSTAATHSALQVREGRSRSPEPLASPHSIAHRPVSQKLTQSWGSMTLVRRAKFSGSFSFIQRIFEAVNAGSTSHPNSPASCAAWEVETVSHQSLAGRMTSPSASTGTKPCCCPLTPMPWTPPASTPASAPRTASTIPSRHWEGCCSPQLGSFEGRRL
mmetsp:Transcript_48779/g.156224  ORF Transcript_48779/g.156224 Transcript_48779/m.156224 type:complete len:217 (+) Transcript_48779:941-1591(+)